jgi:hypothetical protein
MQFVCAEEFTCIVILAFEYAQRSSVDMHDIFTPGFNRSDAVKLDRDFAHPWAPIALSP